MTKPSNLFFLFCLTFYSCQQTIDTKETVRQIKDITKFRQLDTMGSNLTTDSIEKNKCQLFSEEGSFKFRQQAHKTFVLKPIDKNLDTISYRFFSFIGWGNFYRLDNETALTISKCKNDYFVEISENKEVDSLGHRKNFQRTSPIDSVQFKKLQETIRTNGFYDLYSFHYSPCRLSIDGPGYCFEFNDGSNYKYFDIKTIDKKDINLFRQILLTVKDYTDAITRLDNCHKD